jgi:hypothetical protein
LAKEAFDQQGIPAHDMGQIGRESFDLFYELPGIRGHSMRKVLRFKGSRIQGKVWNDIT